MLIFVKISDECGILCKKKLKLHLRYLLGRKRLEMLSKPGLFSSPYETPYPPPAER
ncbi:hypothetical protein PHAMO_470040 [Magnetospirillum molischianum DSM 120]|uniref:Uncharacterized protein n=1 Tax=Magnetospirillum molischianum DSM 120 TaxID=1150626 RepID=H8FWQ1_MAGML|nr:hypothetical protein PHAMO_470040 [Magnetospirillum molischianum DSM 120]